MVKVQRKRGRKNKKRNLVDLANTFVLKL